MRALLLSTLCPVLLLAACGPSETTDAASTDTASTAAPETPAASPPASPPPPPAAPQAAAAPAGADAAEEALAAVQLRQAPMKLLSNQFGPLRGMMQGGVEFNAETVGANAARISLLAGMIPGVFEANPDTAGIETGALPSIWTAKADFDAKAMELKTAADAVVAAAAGGDQAATMAAVGAMGQTCGGCHDDFRAQ